MRLVKKIVKEKENAKKNANQRRTEKEEVL